MNGRQQARKDSHLLPTENETLLGGRNALLLLYLFLDLGNLVVGFNIQLDLLAREGTDSCRLSAT